MATVVESFAAGVRPYAQTYYDPTYLPQDTDLLCAFRIQPRGVDMIEAAAAVAAESSTGTWTEVWSNQLTNLVLPPVLTNLAMLVVEGNDLTNLSLPADLVGLGGAVDRNLVRPVCRRTPRLDVDFFRTRLHFLPAGFAWFLLRLRLLERQALGTACRRGLR